VSLPCHPLACLRVVAHLLTVPTTANAPRFGFRGINRGRTWFGLILGYVLCDEVFVTEPDSLMGARILVHCRGEALISQLALRLDNLGR